jgi:hypothetical protein
MLRRVSLIMLLILRLVPGSLLQTVRLRRTRRRARNRPKARSGKDKTYSVSCRHAGVRTRSGRRRLSGRLS